MIVRTKKYIWLLGVTAILGLTTMPVVMADEGVMTDKEAAKLESKLNHIEDRLRRAKLVVHKLKKDYLNAVENNELMRKEGLPAEDVEHINHEFKHKVETMIDKAVEDINGI